MTLIQVSISRCSPYCTTSPCNPAKMPKILTVDVAHEEQCGTGAGNDGKAADLILYQALAMEDTHGRWWNRCEIVYIPWYNFLIWSVYTFLYCMYTVSDSGILWLWLKFWLCLWLWFKLVLNWVVIGLLAVVVVVVAVVVMSAVVTGICLYPNSRIDNVASVPQLRGWTCIS